MTDSKAHTHNPQGWVDFPNKPAEGISYYTPAQDPPAGTALDPQSDGKTIPLVFQPLKMRGLTLQNRIILSPLCQYSSTDGHMTDWQLTHIGGIVQRGVGLTILEATAVQEIGRITPEDAGLWKDSQIAPLKRIVEFAHGQGQKIAIQLAHAGRKASTVAPWMVRKGMATEKVGGWPNNIVAPSALPFDDSSATPKELTLEDIEELKKDWVSATKRAVEAGFDAIEVHAAHGYLLHSFCSPGSNHRTDKYGGSLDNRIRLVLEICSLTRQNVPSDMPILVRFTGSDWLEHLDTPSWTVDDCTYLAKALAASGDVDFLDVSSGANDPRQKIAPGPGYQAHFSAAVSKAVKGTGLKVGVLGKITEGKQAEGYLQDGTADACIVGRQLLRDPYLVYTWAEALDVEIQIANQMRWALPGAGSLKVRSKV